MMELADGGVRLPRPAVDARKVAKGRREHFTGQLVLGPDEGEGMNFESLYELRVGLVVQARKDIASLENQVPFFYRNADGRPATHFFDYRATQRSGKRIAIMVKAAERAASPRVDDELRVIARQVPSSFADRVVVMTEEDLDPIEVYNAELLHEMRMPEPEVDAAARRAVCSMVGPCELGRLIEMIGHAGLISPT